MNKNTQASKEWRDVQRASGRRPKLIWVTAQEWGSVSAVLAKIKRARALEDKRRKIRE
jgi:hypothetical protein